MATRSTPGRYVSATRADGSYARAHILVAERALGRRLPEHAQVHHVNEDPSDNRPANLVICQDLAYHKLLHQRARALRASGHADWLRCWACKVYKPVSEMRVRSRKKSEVCRACGLQKDIERRRRVVASTKGRSALTRCPSCGDGIHARGLTSHIGSRACVAAQQTAAERVA